MADPGQDSDSVVSDFIWWLLGWGPRILRRVGLKRAVWMAREKATRHIVSLLHFNVLHPMRRLARDLETLKKELDDPSSLAMQICTECRKLMGTYLEISDAQLHCCFKVLIEDPDSPEQGAVATWVRSEPFDDRPVEHGVAQAHQISKNSVWSSLYGVSDGEATWRRFRCFCCNDLTKHDDFVCDRDNWQKYYKSTLVFPIRFPVGAGRMECVYLGFIAFDSPCTGVFRGLPDIMSHKKDKGKYDEKLELSGAFHLGAIMADILGTFLPDVYKEVKEAQSGE